MERYRVEGGGCVVLRLAAGDGMRLVDIEGRQPCEVVAFTADGRIDAGLLAASPTGHGCGLADMLAAKNSRAQRLLTLMQRHGLSASGLRSIDLFGEESRAGDDASFRAAGDAVVVVGAPGRPMRVDGQDPPTELEVFLERAETPPEAPEHELPEPLADTHLDVRVHRATAEAYEVKAGEYIQIIDVEGRQCSDFQAFSAARLHQGVERCLDVTTTRTLMGLGYPKPGLQSKYFDHDMLPLVEVLQDSCPRHDAFGLACMAKYYEDMGYPGHVNCSDNFNEALSPYGIRPRPGWMAMNFFYNTGIDETNQFYLDEPWSQPGDFVLLQALTDLVCVSSACPDDIDPANGWDPTDIHARVYSPEKRLCRSIGYRKPPTGDLEMTKETGFHARTSELTRNLVDYRGYWLPESFTGHGTIEEYWACREKVTVMDLSALRKFEVLGPGAEKLLQHALTRDVRRLSVSQVAYSAMCCDTGGMIGDGTLFRLGRDNFRWIGGDDYDGVWLRELVAALGLEAWVKSSTDQLHNLAVQGPRSRDLLAEVVWTPPVQPPLSELRWFRFTIGRIGGPEGIAVVVSRTGFTGELGYEVWCHPREAEAVWDAIWEAGKARGLIPLGLSALDMLRIEAGLVVAGREFDDQVDPFEAGIGFAVALEQKRDDFVGREALARRREGPQRRMVGLELEGEEPGAHGDPAYVARQRVGMVTSAARSPILGKNIALCRMAVEHSAIGSRVEIGKLDGQRKRILAVVVPLPFYDPEKTRVRG